MRRDTLDRGYKSSGPLSWSDMRLYNLLDTGVSGAMTGGFLNTLRRTYATPRILDQNILTRESVAPGGRPGLVPGLCTGTLVCTLLQWTYNELGIARVKYVSRTKVPPSPHKSHPTSSPASERPPPELQRPWSHKVLEFFGFQHISDEEYLARLKTTRDSALRRIEMLEREADKKSKEALSESKNNL
jgi:hypothetical protein